MMPSIQMKLMEEDFTPNPEKQIGSNLTDAVVSLEGENMRPFTWVSVEEICSLE